MKKLIFAFTVVCFIAAMALAETKSGQGTAAEAKAMVAKAAACVKQQGPDQAYAEINNPKGGYVDRDLYIYIIDLKDKGKVLAHGGNAKLIGKNVLDLRDGENKLFIREIIEKATANNEGWVNYKWTNPVSKKIENKSAFFLKQGDVIVLCGIYSK